MGAVTEEWEMESCFWGITVGGNWGSSMRVRVCFGDRLRDRVAADLLWWDPTGVQRDTEDTGGQTRLCKGLTSPLPQAGTALRAGQVTGDTLGTPRPWAEGPQNSRTG